MTRTIRFFLTLTLLSIAANVSLAQVPFKDVTEQVGLKGLSGGTAAWSDFNNDGWVDFVSGGTIWKNVDGKKFERLESSVSGAAIWGDFDNDGDPDLFTFSGQGFLYRNDQGKSFALVEGAIPELPMKVCLGAVFVDIENDGDLDLYVGGYEIWQKAVYLDVILENRDGKFVEKWRQTKAMTARGITSCDHDEDGDVDIYVSNYRLFKNLLWQNDGKGSFKNVADENGTAGDGDLGAWGHTIGSAWGDMDNDGHFDLFVGNFSHPPAYQDRPKFLRNLGPKKKFAFEDVSKNAGLQWQESFASPTLGDVDNDGDLDLFFTTVYQGDTSVLYLNDGNWKFSNVSKDSNVQTAGTYQAAFADFDNDGDLDLLSGGKLFANPGNKNHWIKVRLIVDAAEGEKELPVNRSAIGSQVRIRLGDKTLSRQITSAVGQGNQNDPTLHYGLGDHSEKLKIEITWPDGKKQSIESEVDRAVTVRKSK